jgi:hypothetical protein
MIEMFGHDSNVALERESQPMKQLSPIIVTEDGTQTDESDEQLANA